MVHGKRRGSTAPGEAAASTAASNSLPAKKAKSRVSDSLSQLILQAFQASHPRKSLSLAALKKLVSEAGYNVSRNNSRLKRELQGLVSNGLLVRVTGSGASGSFRFVGNRAKKKTAAAPAGGKLAKGRPNKAAASTGATRQPKNKARKKQPAVNKPKGLQSRTSAAPDRKRQVNKRPKTKRGLIK